MDRNRRRNRFLVILVLLAALVLAAWLPPSTHPATNVLGIILICGSLIWLFLPR